MPLLSTTAINPIECKASWQGAKFFDFELEGLTTVDNLTNRDIATNEPDQGDLAYRYVAAVGSDAKGKADCDYPVVISRAEDSTNTLWKATHVAKAKRARVMFDKLDVDAYPTLHHIEDVLADVPIYEIVRLLERRSSRALGQHLVCVLRKGLNR